MWFPSGALNHSGSSHQHGLVTIQAVQFTSSQSLLPSSHQGRCHHKKTVNANNNVCRGLNTEHGKTKAWASASWTRLTWHTSPSVLDWVSWAIQQQLSRYINALLFKRVLAQINLFLFSFLVRSEDVFQLYMFFLYPSEWIRGSQNKGFRLGSGLTSCPFVQKCMFLNLRLGPGRQLDKHWPLQ